MSDKQSAGSSTSNIVIQWSTLVAIGLAVTGVLLRSPSLESSRPSESGTTTGEERQESTARARLWQDPFQAARSHWQNALNFALWKKGLPASKEGKDSTAPEDSSYGLPAPKLITERHLIDKGPSLLLPVMVDAEPYAERLEQRIRVRVGVVEGLTRSGFVSVDPTHVSYVHMNLNTGSTAREVLQDTPNCNSLKTGTFLIPYEVFRKGKTTLAQNTGQQAQLFSQYSQVVLLWIDESIAGRKPLAFLGQLLRQMRQTSTGSRDPTFDIKVIGPQTSDTLRYLVREVNDLRSVQCLSSLNLPWNELTFVSATATADDTYILREAATTSSKKQTVEDFVGSTKALKTSLHRWVLQDGKLCGTLVSELKNRHLRLKSGEDQVAVVTEMDTLYGRSLLEAFEKRMIDDGLAGPSSDPPRNEVHRFYYLRGLDGRTAGPQSSNDSSHEAKPADSPGSRSDIPKMVSEGLNQADYLRRLAEQLRTLDAAMKTSGKRLGAVGVLGTDLYDKLLVLHALRKELPGVVFFTTGLDARYGLRDEWQYTHNLVTASDYGLVLHRAIQGNIPPFRDGNQTAIFAATLATCAMPDQTIQSHLHPAQYAPRLFEIGRDGPFDLTVGDNRNNESVESAFDYWAQHTDPSGIPSQTALHPPRPDNILLNSQQWDTLKILAFVTICLIGFGMTLGIRPKKLRISHLFHSGWVVLLLSLGGGTVIAFFLSHIDWERNEPFSFASGISAWPSFVIYVAAAGLSTCLIYRTVKEGNRSNRQLEELFSLRSWSNQIQDAILNAKVTSTASASKASRLLGYLSSLEKLGDKIFNRILKSRNVSLRRFRSRMSYAGWAVYRPLKVPIAASNPGTEPAGTPQVPVGSPASQDGKSPKSDEGFDDDSDRLTRLDYERRVDPPARLPTQVCAQQLWWNFLIRFERLPRIARILSMAILFAIGIWLLSSLLGYPYRVGPAGPPARGQFATWLWIAEVIASFGFLGLLFTVLEATYLNKRLIQFLGRHTTHWPAAGKPLNTQLKAAFLDEWGSSHEVDLPANIEHSSETKTDPENECALKDIADTEARIGSDQEKTAEDAERPDTTNESGTPGKLDTGNSAFKTFMKNPADGDFVDWTEYIDIQFIAERTRVIGDAIYYPFPIIFFLMLARWSLFDDWSFPLATVIEFALCTLLAIGGAFSLRRTVEAARRGAMACIDARIRLFSRESGTRSRRSNESALRGLLEEIRLEKRGAFSILSNYPTFAAILLPSGGVGLWALLEQFPRLLH